MRIVSLSPAATETLFALGLGSSIVGVDQFSNFPEEAKKIHHLRDHQNIRIADVRELKPDLILTATVIQEKLAAELKQAGLPVFHQDSRTLEAVLKSIVDLAVVVAVEQRGVELVTKLRSEFAALRTKTRLLPAKAKVYSEEWHNPPMVSGNWVPDILTYAGVQSFPIRAGELSRAVTLEEVQKFDPDLILISWCGAGNLADKKLLMEREGWSVLRAVQKGNVFVIDDSLLNRPGPRLLEGAQKVYSRAFEVLHGGRV
jgi:iron complex transport system substrate-binding protein